MRYGVAAALLLAVTAGATYEAAVAMKWISLGEVPGEEAPYFGSSTRRLSSPCWSAQSSPGPAWRHESNVFVALLGIAAAALVVTSFYSFDPYYLPTMRRYSDGGTSRRSTRSRIWALEHAALSTSPRIGFVVNAPPCPLRFTVTFLGVGH